MVIKYLCKYAKDVSCQSRLLAFKELILVISVQGVNIFENEVDKIKHISDKSISLHERFVIQPIGITLYLHICAKISRMNVTDKEEGIMPSNQYNKRINKYTMSMGEGAKRRRERKGKKKKRKERAK